MADTEVSIKIKDQIGTKIAAKLAAIGESAAAAAPGLTAFKKAWAGLDFSGLKGIGLGSVEQQMKRVAVESKRLAITIERLKQSQNQTAISTNNYQKSLNGLRIQEEQMIKTGMGKVAATSSQSVALKKLGQVTNVTSMSTTDLTAKQIKSQLSVNKLAISNNELLISQDKVKMSTVDLQMKQNGLALSANRTATSAVNLDKSHKQLSSSTATAASSTVSLNKNMNALTLQEVKLDKAGLGAEKSQNRLRASMVGMAQSTNVAANFTSKLSKSEIKRQTSLAKLAKTQTLAKKAEVDLAIARVKLAGATNKNTLATQKYDVATKRATISVGRLVANIKRMKAAAMGGRGALGGMVSSLRSYVSLGALVGAGGALKGIDSFKRIQNQLRGTTTNSKQLNEVTDKLFGVAKRSRVPIADLTIAYRRYDNALAKTGMGQKGSLRITETIGKMLSLNGASAQESASALLQLSQAFNKGKLDGDEFRSVAELMPQILDAIAKATGKSRKELYKMSEQGLITVDVLIKAFESLQKPIDKLMEDSVRTIGQSFTLLTNKLIYQFGQWDKKTKFTEKLAKILDEIGENTDYILKSMRALAAGLLASGAASMVGGFFALVISGVGNLALIPGIISLIVGRIVYLGDQISFVFGKGFFGEDLKIGLTEIINKLMFDFVKLFKFAVSLAGAFFDVLIPASTGQGLAEVFLEILAIVKDIMFVVIGIIAGIGRAISNLVSGVNDVKKDISAGEEISALDSALGRAGTRIKDLLMELPTFLTLQIIKLGSTITEHLAPVIASIMFEISQGLGELKWFIQNPISAMAGKTWENPLARKFTEPMPIPLDTKEMARKLNEDMNSVFKGGDFGKNAPSFGFEGFDKKIVSVEKQAEKYRDLFADIVVEKMPNASATRQWAEVNKMMAAQEKKITEERTKRQLKLEEEYLEKSNAWKAKSLAEDKRIEAIRQGMIQTRTASIKESAATIQKSLDLAIGSTSPLSTQFFDDIYQGMRDFKKEADSLLQSFVNRIKLSKFGAFDNLRLPAEIENKLKGVGLVVKNLKETFNSFGSTAIRVIENLIKIIQDPQLRGGLNFLIGILKKIIEVSNAVTKVSSTLRKDKNIPPGVNPKDSGLPEMTDQASALQSVFNNLSNAFQNFVKTGKLSFKELMRSILADLLKMFMNNLFKQLFSGMMGGGGGGGGFLSGLFGMAGGGSVPIAGGNGSGKTLFSSGFG